ncbi:HepT-like ribonuclease domain-containing protein [Sphingomonas baiyangensis]|uniref:DUF86 domain-containing protein n=1 Tax=Sphingomonas baiyangensis TaxID=2572576 RepID=A0A4U1L8Y9_9SPHN|nr:HepT-like ribonuclease domain-containing protein [Sphingomonas baiyangensis]TKD53304.1 DUF86 domain-containing protein [Sphingomonas baiyangensis]
MFSSRTALRLRDIVEDVDRITTFLGDASLDVFVADEKTLFAVERLLQRITEAAVQIDPDEAASIGPDLPVAKMRALGNRLRHEYREVDRRVIDEIARNELPALRAACVAAMER